MPRSDSHLTSSTKFEYHSTLLVSLKISLSPFSPISLIHTLSSVLAVQNLKGLNVFGANSEHAIEYSALEGSLQMMSQVLNVSLSRSFFSIVRAKTDFARRVKDVLDFSRMERGGFSSVSRPFSLHNLMRSIFVPLRLDAAARGLDLETNLDNRVDELARLAAYPEESVEDVREGDGMVMGDEMRLRQIIGNLISNACSEPLKSLFQPTFSTELIPFL